MESDRFAPITGFIDLLLDAVCVVDAAGTFVYASAACERIFGYTPQEMVGRVMIDMVHPDDQARTSSAAGTIMAGTPTLDFENRYVRKDGRVVHIMWSARWSEADQMRIAVARDVTERRQAEATRNACYAISEAAHTANDLQGLFDQLHPIIATLLPARHCALALVDRQDGPLQMSCKSTDGTEVSIADRRTVSALCADIIRTGQSLTPAPDDTISPEMLSSPKSFDATRRKVDGSVDSDAIPRIGVPLTSSKGVIGALCLTGHAETARYSQQDQELLQFVAGQVSTAIERKQLHAELRHMAQYDGLTGLPNRGLLLDRLDMALARSVRENEQMAVLFVDLDRFKQVNDTLGHATGDLLLQEVARRLTQCVRHQDTVARMSGDEFVILLLDIRQPAHAEMVAEQIRCTVSEPILLAGQRLRVVPSIGIALYPEHGTDARQLLLEADRAMYTVKTHTRTTAIL